MLVHLGDYDTDEETDRLLNKPYQGEGNVELPADTQELGTQAMKNKAKEGKKILASVMLFNHL